MLKQRVLTAAVLAPLFVLAVLYLPPVYFALLTGLLVLLAALEWTEISGFPENRHKILGSAVAVFLMTVLYICGPGCGYPVILGGGALWCVVMWLLWSKRQDGVIRWPPTIRWVAGLLVLLPAWLGLTWLQRSAPALALLLMVFVWSADIGAYFSGKRWGKTKLAPAISPGKSVEGVIGGVLLTLVVAMMLFKPLGIGQPLLLWLAWTVLVVLFSITGDLFESNWKRVSGIKDSGSLLPGHGGVLDRIDSLTAAAPVFVLGWAWWFHAADA